MNVYIFSNYFPIYKVYKLAQPPTITNQQGFGHSSPVFHALSVSEGARCPRNILRLLVAWEAFTRTSGCALPQPSRHRSTSDLEISSWKKGRKLRSARIWQYACVNGCVCACPIALLFSTQQNSQQCKDHGSGFEDSGTFLPFLFTRVSCIKI